MVNERLDKLKKNLESLEERINELLGETNVDGKMEKVRKHKKAMREVQKYYSEKVR